MKFGIPNYPLTQNSLIEGKLMNFDFVRRVTSSVIASLFALSFGVGGVQIVNAEDTKRLKFCRDNPSLFHLNEGKERKVRIAVFNVGNIDFTSYPELAPEKNHQFRGIGKILAGELAKNNNFTVVNWNQIKPKDVRIINGGYYRVGIDSISIEDLRYFRNTYGVEAVIIPTVNLYDLNRENEQKFLGFGTKKKNNEVQVKLNFRVIDTTTGDIVFSAQGNGRDRKSYTSVTVPKINASITNRSNRDFDINSSSWTQRTRGSIIEFKLNSGDEPETIISSGSNSILTKLLAGAAEDAISQVVEQLNFRSDELACLVRKPTLIAATYFDKHNQNIVILNKGRLHGYCEGMTFSIESSPYPIVDPATERVIRVITNKVGRVTLTEIDAQSSVGIGITEPGQYFRVKDMAKLTSDAKKCLENKGKGDSKKPT